MRVELRAANKHQEKVPVCSAGQAGQPRPSWGLAKPTMCLGRISGEFSMYVQLIKEAHTEGVKHPVWWEKIVF